MWPILNRPATKLDVFRCILLALVIAALTQIVVMAVDKVEPSPIFDLAQNGKTAEIIRLLKDNPALLESQDKYGWTPLMYASGFHQVATVHALIDAGANIEARDTSGYTALDCVKGSLKNCTPEWLKTQEDFLREKKLPEAEITAQMDKIRTAHSDQARKEWQQVLDILRDAKKGKATTAPAPTTATKPTGT